MATQNQAPPKPLPPLGVPIFVWLVIVTLCGLIANFLHDALFEPIVMGAFLLCGFVLVVACRFRNNDDPRSWFLVCGQGLFLGIALLLCSAFAWVAAEILLRGRSTEIVLWPARLALAFFYAAILLILLTKRRRLIANIVQWGILSLIALALIALGVYSLGIAGPVDTSIYPPPSESPYRLPWKGGVTFTCTQGNLSDLSHSGWQNYAYDFVMPTGTEVCAARRGNVVKVVDQNDGNGVSAPANVVNIIHEDGTIAQYVHIRQGGSRVKVNQWVEQGDVIAESGNVGYSLQPHLHFHVVQNRVTIPVSFADVPGDGIPRTMRRYVSGQKSAE
jgi:murein DD-endopeptidase MepM/ murein hydrolase activator NlpD